MPAPYQYQIILLFYLGQGLECSWFPALTFFHGNQTLPCIIGVKNVLPISNGMYLLHSANGQWVRVMFLLFLQLHPTHAKQQGIAVLPHLAPVAGVF